MKKAEEIAEEATQHFGLTCAKSINTHASIVAERAVNRALEWAAQQCEEYEKAETLFGSTHNARIAGDCADSIRAGKSVG